MFPETQDVNASKETLQPDFYNLAHVDTNLAANSINGSVQEFDDSRELIYEDDDDVSTTKESKQYKTGSRIFLGVSVLSAAGVLTLEAVLYAIINIHRSAIPSEERFAEISIYLALFIFAAVYQLLLTLIGLRTKNMVLLGMLCVFYGCMLVYTGIQFEEVSKVFMGGSGWRRAASSANIAAIVLLAVTFVVQSSLLIMLRRHVQWVRFKKIGADPLIRWMYTIFQLHRCLLVFDFFFFLGFTIQFIVIMVNKRTSVEFILTIVVLPLTILILFMADIAASREIRTLTVGTVVLFCGGLAYMLFKMIRLYTKYTSAFDVAFKPGGYFPGRKSMITFGAITIFLLITTLVFEGLVFWNYRRGLLPLVNTYYSWLPGHIQTKELGHKHSIDSDLKPGADNSEDLENDNKSMIID